MAGRAQVDWKLTRGKWRPKLLDYAKAHSEATVKAATSAASELISSLQTDESSLKAAMGCFDGAQGGLAVLRSACRIACLNYCISVHI